MQRRDAYPIDTATGSCFLTGDYDTSEGVVDLDLYLDVLPPFGRLCISPKAVRMLVQVMGWEWPEQDLVANMEAVVNENHRLRQENQRMRGAVARILQASKLALLDEWVEMSDVGAGQ